MANSSQGGTFYTPPASGTGEQSQSAAAGAGAFSPAPQFFDAASMANLVATQMQQRLGTMVATAVRQALATKDQAQPAQDEDAAPSTPSAKSSSNLNSLGGASASTAAAAMLTGATQNGSSLTDAATTILDEAAKQKGFSNTTVVDRWMQNDFFNREEEIPVERKWTFPDSFATELTSPTHCDGRPTVTTPGGYIIPQATNGTSEPLSRKQVQIGKWDHDKFRKMENLVFKEFAAPVIKANGLEYKPQRNKDGKSGERYYHVPNQVGLPTERESVTLTNTINAVENSSEVQFTVEQKRAASVHAHMERKLLATERVYRFLLAEQDTREACHMEDRAEADYDAASETAALEEMFELNRRTRTWMLAYCMQLRICNTHEMMCMAGLVAADKKKEAPGAMALSSWASAETASKTTSHTAKAVALSRTPKRRSMGAFSNSPAKSPKTEERADATGTFTELAEEIAAQVQTV